MRAAEDLHPTNADPDAACARCHRDIYERYRKTPMANASGPATEGVIPADFRHAASGVHYRVYEEGGRVWMSYAREGTDGTGTREQGNKGAEKPGLGNSDQGNADLSTASRTQDDKAGVGDRLWGRQELKYFLGSGKRGRTYLFEQEGYWFEAPINWYAKKQLWDMTPNHLADREMPLTLPVDPGCLHCHASGVASSLPDARNHYAGAPFAYGGITCEACHGDASAHVASGGKTSMLKLDALDAVRRDSVCLNCHLEGQTAVNREGRKPEDFRPGDNLFDFAQFFVYRNVTGSGGRATSQWEALLGSECKKKSGDRLTCTTCHDPHGGPSEQERVSYYRERCLGCHGGEGFGARHHAENRDCTACHMARAATTDIAHEQVTDHLIRRRIAYQGSDLSQVSTTGRPGAPGPAAPGGGELEAVGTVAGDRELGLAYAEMAVRGDQAAGERALKLLERDEAETKGAPGDTEVHDRLGFLEQVSGHRDAAAGEYNRAIEANPYDSLALGDLALIKARQHQYAEAEQLWKTAFDHDPVQIGAGMNLAIVECADGKRADALQTLERVLVFAPDNSKARSLAAEIREGKTKCAAR